MEKIPKKQLNALIKDEREAVQMYRGLGLPGLAADEQRHMNFFKMLKARR